MKTAYTLDTLPPELYLLIFSHLSGIDLLSLEATCKRLHNAVVSEWKGGPVLRNIRDNTGSSEREDVTLHAISQQFSNVMRAFMREPWGVMAVSCLLHNPYAFDPIQLFQPCKDWVAMVSGDTNAPLDPRVPSRLGRFFEAHSTRNVSILIYDYESKPPLQTFLPFLPLMSPTDSCELHTSSLGVVNVLHLHPMTISLLLQSDSEERLVNVGLLPRGVEALTLNIPIVLEFAGEWPQRLKFFDWKGEMSQKLVNSFPTSITHLIMNGNYEDAELSLAHLDSLERFETSEDSLPLDITTLSPTVECVVAPEGIMLAVLATIGQFPKLKAVSIIREDLSGVRTFPHQKLYFSRRSGPAMASAVDLLAYSASFPLQVEDITIAGGNITSTMEFRNLTKLEFHFVTFKLNRVGLFSYASLFEGLESVRHLSFQYCTGNAKISSSWLPRNLRTLKVYRCITRFTLHHLPEKLISLDHQFSSEITVKMHSLPRTLKSLSLTGQNVVEECFVDLPPNLETVNLSRNRIRRIDLSSLPAGVIALDLSENELSEPALNDLPQSLERLNLSTNSITRVRLRKLPQMLRMLDLSANGLQNVDLRFIPESLTDINLQENGISHFDFRTLPSTVLSLNLSNNRIEDADLSNLHGLVSLDLSKNGLRTIQFPSNRHAFLALELSHNLFERMDLRPAFLMKSRTLMGCLEIKEVRMSKARYCSRCYEIETDDGYLPVDHLKDNHPWEYNGWLKLVKWTVY